MKKLTSPNKSKKKLLGTIYVTPTWESLVPMFIDWIQDGNSEQHIDASENIMQMAKVSDAYRANEYKIKMHDELMLLLKSINNKGRLSPMHLPTIKELIKQESNNTRG